MRNKTATLDQQSSDTHDRVPPENIKNRCLEIRLWGAPGTPNEYVCDNQVTHNGNEYLSEELQELDPSEMSEILDQRAIKWEADGILATYLIIGTNKCRRLLSTVKAAITH